jgi:hypothetical protein
VQIALDPSSLTLDRADQPTVTGSQIGQPRPQLSLQPLVLELKRQVSGGGVEVRHDNPAAKPSLQP